MKIATGKIATVEKTSGQFLSYAKILLVSMLYFNFFSSILQASVQTRNHKDTED
jgi:hypothetical protein